MTNSLLTQESDNHIKVMNCREKPDRTLLLLVTIFAQSLLPLVSRHLMTLTFFTAWHDLIFYSFVPAVLPDSNLEMNSSTLAETTSSGA
jgi:hypothetical protein